MIRHAIEVTFTDTELREIETQAGRAYMTVERYIHHAAIAITAVDKAGLPKSGVASRRTGAAGHGKEEEEPHFT